MEHDAGQSRDGEPGDAIRIERTQTDRPVHDLDDLIGLAEVQIRQSEISVGRHLARVQGNGPFVLAFRLVEPLLNLERVALGPVRVGIRRVERDRAPGQFGGARDVRLSIRTLHAADSRRSLDRQRRQRNHIIRI